MTIEVVRVTKKRGIPPASTTFTSTFWNALENGTFQTTRCKNCDMLHFPPRQVCSTCGAQDMKWEPLSGEGLLYSRTRIHAGLPQFGPDPIDVAIVDLVEGVRIVCALVDANAARIDEPIKIVALEFDDGVLFGARPID